MEEDLDAIDAMIQEELGDLPQVDGSHDDDLGGIDSTDDLSTWMDT